MRSGRSGTGTWRYRKNRATLLAADDLCRICLHRGAATADHIITARDWPRGKPGFDEMSNLQPAHGTMGAGVNRLHNPCPVCGRLCNQSRGARRALPPRPQSRNW
jgi:hypothetical protein